MWRSFRQVLPTFLIILSSYFLIKSVLALSSADIASLSHSKWDYSIEVAQNLCRQRADTIIGFSLLLLSIVAQLIVWCFHTGLDFNMNRKGIPVAIVFIIIVYFIANGVSNYLYNTQYHQVELILKTPPPSPNK